MKKFDQYGVTEQLRNDTKKLFNGILADVVKKYDPTIFYWPSSPYGGDPDAKCESGKPNWNPNGDAHYWGVWQGVDSVAHFNKVKARFFSEYGFQSFPEYQSVLKYAPEERDHDIYSDVMMAHQRGGQMPYNMGSLFWLHNDCWPVASWSSRDYYGRWKAQHYFTKKAFRDILVSPIAEDGTLNVWVISDRLKAVKGKLDIRVMDLKGTVLFSKNSNVTLPANTSKIQFSAPVESLLAGKNLNEVVVNARFIENGKESEVISNNYFFTRYKDIDFPKADIQMTSVPAADGFDVTVQSDVFARAVFGDDGGHVIIPILRQYMGIYPPALLLDGGKPDQLQIHVVVGDGVGDILHKSVHVVDAAVAFKGRPQGAADVLSQIAPLYLAVISLKIHVHVLPR